jgi:thymidine kinase
MNLRVDQEGRAVRAGAQTEIGGNDRYVALCRRHFMERLKEAELRQLRFTLADSVAAKR